MITLKKEGNAFVARNQEGQILRMWLVAMYNAAECIMICTKRYGCSVVYSA